MTFRDRTGLLLFILTVTATAMMFAVLVDYLTRSLQLATSGPLHAMASAGVCALPIAWFVGTRLVLLRRLKDQIETAARHDRLTGLLNRPSFLDMLAARPPRKGIVALVDVDFFKRINDTHGHFVGDEVLAHVAATLAAACRPGDLVCRFGGEEFAILFADATRADAQALAQGLVRRMSERPVLAGGVRHDLTVSVGFAERDDRQEVTQALMAADKALYRAKARGRNCAIAAWEPAPVAGVRSAA